MSEDTDQTARIAELEADNARLRRLLDQRDAPGELRHRLRSTLAMLRTIIRRTAETELEFESYVAHLEDRLDALMRAQAAADERGFIGLSDLLADELQHYGIIEGETATLCGPEIELQPRAGQVFAMAIHELTVNAVEHGQLGDQTGRIEVTWTVTTDEGNPSLTFSWKESSKSEKVEIVREGFGTEVLTQLLSYELKARTTLAVAEGGLQCTIRFPLSERTGRLAEN